MIRARITSYPTSVSATSWYRNGVHEEVHIKRVNSAAIMRSILKSLFGSDPLVSPRGIDCILSPSTRSNLQHIQSLNFSLNTERETFAAD
jgi:hypothetical protein